jgi:hypothetical protein
MAIAAERKYDGRIREGSYFAYSMNGNLALHILLDCEDGSTSFTLWLTEKNKAKAIKTLETLGADPAKLSNQNYLDYELANVLAGKEVSFGTKEDDYNGKTSIKVAWIGKKTDPNVGRGAASFFGGKVQNNEEPPPFTPGDSDIPF